MEKTFLLIFAAAALMLAGANASAQVSFGAGPTTRLYFEKGQNVNYTYGVQVNFEDSKRLTDVFGYSAGIDFGTYAKKDFFSETTDLSEMYVDIPVRAKFYIPFSDDVQLYFFGGVVPSMCVVGIRQDQPFLRGLRLFPVRRPRGRRHWPGTERELPVRAGL